MISPMVYGLDLPPVWRFHLVFHVFNLKRFHWSKEFERQERPPSLIVVNGEKEYELVAILRYKDKAAQQLYLVIWKGYPITEASWEPKLHLQSAALILEDTCTPSGPTIGIDTGIEGTGRKVVGGSQKYKATVVFVTKG